MSILLWITIEVIKYFKKFCCLPTVVKNSTLKGLSSTFKVRSNYVLSMVEGQYGMVEGQYGTETFLAATVYDIYISVYLLKDWHKLHSKL